jgi:hypothetical protein
MLGRSCLGGGMSGSLGIGEGMCHGVGEVSPGSVICFMFGGKILRFMKVLHVSIVGRSMTSSMFAIGMQRQTRCHVYSLSALNGTISTVKAYRQ